MAVQYIDNLSYKGKKGNFERDQFATLADMAAYSEDCLDEGHLAVCLEDGKRYEWKSGNESDDTTGRWREFTAGGVTEVTHAELVALRDGGNLVAGAQYRITDYAATTSAADTQSANHQFDIIVTADSAEALSETARAARHDGDTYFANSKLEAWELRYCIDNDTSRFIWADETNGKGVVYEMRDEWDNKAPYDFKNIQFKRYLIKDADSNISSLAGTYTGIQGALQEGLTLDEQTYIWAYTFSTCGYILEDEELTADYGELNDSSLNNRAAYDPDGGGYAHPVIYCEKNHIAAYRVGVVADDETSTQPLSLNNIVILDEPSYYGGDDDVSARVEFNSSASNTFKLNCHDITALKDFTSNTFGNSCYSNTFGNSCYSNTFGNSCHSNTFGNSCHSNTFGNYCYHNTFGNYCYYNTFGNGCHSNTFGNYCYSNTFGNSCSSNTFGEESAGSSYAAYMRYSIVDDGVCYITLTSSATGSGSAYLQNIHICQGVCGTGTLSRKEISATRGLAYQVEYKAAGSVTTEV